MDVFSALKELDNELIDSSPCILYVCGGAAMIALGIEERVTQDIDAILPPLNQELINAASKVAKKLGLSANWLNNGPSSLIQDLEPGWEDRTIVAFEGKRLTVRCLGRLDMIKTKLWATCDRMEDLQDVIALQPTNQELEDAKAWVLLRDGSEVWGQILDFALNELQKRKNK